jgi:hypothetical protein
MSNSGGCGAGNVGVIFNDLELCGHSCLRGEKGGEAVISNAGL